MARHRPPFHWRSLSLLAFAHVAAHSAVGQTEVHWANPAGGSWFTGSNWASGIVPNNGTETYHAFIDLAGNPYTVTLNSSATVSHFTLDSSAATVSHTAGTFGVLGTATLNSGVFQLNGGTIAGGVWNVAPGRFSVGTSASSRLDGVTWNGDLALAAANSRLRITNGLTLNGTAVLAGNGANLTFEGTQTFDNATLRFDPSTFGNKTVSIPTDSILTLGAGAQIRGGRGFFSGAGNLINAGSILADVSGQSIAIETAEFENAGSIAAQLGGAVTIGASGNSWINGPGGVIANTSGTVTLQGNWSNQGGITVSNGTLNLGGNFTTGGLGTIQRTGGTVNLTGVLNNTGNQLNFNTTTGSWNLSGTIRGGSISFADGVRMGFQNGFLDGVTWNGDLTLSAASARVRVINGINITGNAVLSGSNTTLAFEGTQTFDNTSLRFDASTGGTKTVSTPTGSALTLGPNLTVRGGRGQFTGAGAILNEGSILADASGQALTVAPGSFTNSGSMQVLPGATMTIGASGTTWANASGGSIMASNATLNLRGAWSNAGLISATNSTVELGGTFTTAGLGNFQRSGGTVNLTGVLENTGSSLTLNASTGSWNLLGTIRGGSLGFADGARLVFSNSTANYLDGVAIQAPLDLSVTGSAIRLSPTTTFNGPIQFSASSIRVGLDTGQVRDNTSIHFSTGVNTVSAEGNGTLTFGPNHVIDGAGGEIRSGVFLTGTSPTIVNQGRISANIAGAIDVGPANFINEGILEATSGGTLRLGLDQVNPRPWSNSGLVRAGVGGIVHLGGTWTNTGTLRLDGGSLRLSGNFSTASTAGIERNGGTLSLYNGVLNNTGATLTLGPENPWNFYFGTIQGGTLNLAPGGLVFGEDNTTGGVNELRDVTVNGVLEINPPLLPTYMLLSGTTTVSGPVNVRRGSTLRLEGGRTFDNLTVNLGEIPRRATLTGFGDGRVTFGPSMVIRGISGEISGPDLLNLGLIQADSTYGIEIRGDGEFENRGGMRAVAGANLMIGTSTIYTRTWSNAASGLIESNGGGIHLGSIWTNEGQIRTEGGTLEAGGEWMNNAAISAANSTVTLGGTWRNNGTISVSNSAVTLSGNFRTADIGNFVRVGGTVDLSGAQVDNTNDVLRLDASTGNWKLRGNGQITGGILDQAEGARLTFGAGTTDGGTLNGVIVNGDLDIFGTLNIENGITLTSGIVTIGAGELRVRHGATLDNLTVQFTGQGGSIQPFGVDVGPLILGQSFVARGGRGQFSTPGSGISESGIINRGTITATDGQSIGFPVRNFVNEGNLGTESGGTLKLGDLANDNWTNTTDGRIVANTGTVELRSRVSMSNFGVVEARNGARITVFTPTTLTNRDGNRFVGGTWSIFAGSTLEIPQSTFTTNAANVTLSGPGSVFAAIDPLSVNEGSFTLAEGRDFTTVASIENRGALSLGSGSVLTVAQGYSQFSDGLLELMLASSDPIEGLGQVDANGPIDLAGALEIVLEDSYVPAPGTEFVLLSAPSIAGAFSDVSLPGLPGGWTFELNYSATAVTLSVVPEPVSGAMLLLGAACIMRRRRN